MFDFRTVVVAIKKTYRLLCQTSQKQNYRTIRVSNFPRFPALSTGFTFSRAWQCYMLLLGVLIGSLYYFAWSKPLLDSYYYKQNCNQPMKAVLCLSRVWIYIRHASSIFGACMALGQKTFCLCVRGSNFGLSQIILIKVNEEEIESDVTFLRKYLCHAREWSVPESGRKIPYLWRNATFNSE